MVLDRLIRLAALGVILSACGVQKLPSHLKESSDPLSNAPILNAQGLKLASADGRILLQVQPAVQIAGRWLLPANESSCTYTLDELSCVITDQGTVKIQRDGRQVYLSFVAAKATQIQALALRGSLSLPDARGWLSNGFQSWSQTGVVSLKAEPKSADFTRASTATGEDEVYRRGSELSWWYSFVGNDEQSFLAGASSADRFRSYVQFYKQSQGSLLQANFVSGGTESIRLEAGGSLIGERWYLGLGPKLQDQLDAYADTLSSRLQQKPSPAMTGWNSWYDLWDDVEETDFLANSALVKDIWQSRLPTSAGPVTITLDDGWEKNWGDWYPNSKFPSGIDAVAKKVKADGFQFGLWLAPLLVDPKSDVALKHPEWLVTSAVYKSPSGTNYRILDVTQAAVAEHLQATIRRLVSYGAQVLKIDFLFGGTLEGGRSRNVTGMEAYHIAMRLIREAAGESTTLLAVGAPPLATFPYVDGWRVGGDIAFKPAVFGIPRPGPTFIANQARSLAGRYPYCRVTHCDADPALLRALPKDEVETGTWIAAATGGALILSDNLLTLPKERRTWGYDSQKIALGLSGQTARLESYFPSTIPAELNNMKDGFFTAEQNVPEIWLMADGRRVGMNFSSGPKIIGGLSIPKNASRLLP